MEVVSGVNWIRRELGCSRNLANEKTTVLSTASRKIGIQNCFRYINWPGNCATEVYEGKWFSGKLDCQGFRRKLV